MNERMLELYRQAQVPDTAIDPSNNMPYETTTFSAEKFAELIVQECADVANQHMEHNEGTDYNVGGKIKQHFGVE
jgi:hypothetical protein